MLLADWARVFSTAPYTAGSGTRPFPQLREPGFPPSSGRRTNRRLFLILGVFFFFRSRKGAKWPVHNRTGFLGDRLLEFRVGRALQPKSNCFLR